MKTVLVVDDEKDICELLRAHLEEEGFSVVTAQDGRQGLRLAKKVRPDLILLDIAMPKMDGLEMLDILRKIPGFSETTVLILSAHKESHNILDAEDSEALDFLIKPFTRKTLLKAVKKVLGTF